MAAPRSHTVLLVAGGTAVLLLVAVLALVWWGGRGTERDAAAAIADYRERAHQAPAGPDDGPRPGVYSFDQRGSERGAMGPLALNRDLPESARLIIAPHGDGWSEELVLAEQHIEEAHLRRRDGRVEESWRRSDITFVGVGRDDRRPVAPPLVRLPAEPKSGMRWTSRAQIGTVTMDLRGVVGAPATVIVAGERHPALVIRTTTTSGGAHPGVRRDTLWWSARHRLPLRWEITTRIRGIVDLDTRASLRLRSVIPAR